MPLVRVETWFFYSFKGTENAYNRIIHRFEEENIAHTMRVVVGGNF
jgi:hypothetical protein